MRREPTDIRRADLSCENEHLNHIFGCADRCSAKRTDYDSIFGALSDGIVLEAFL